jgi:hypothetical protein
MGARKCRLEAGACWPERGKRECSVDVRPDVQALALMKLETPGCMIRSIFIIVVVA